MKSTDFRTKVRAIMWPLAVRVAEGLGPLLAYVPIKGVVKRLLFTPPLDHFDAPDRGELQRRLSMFLDVRSHGGGVSELGIEWLLNQGSQFGKVACLGDGPCSRQIAYALSLAGAQVDTQSMADINGFPLEPQTMARFDCFSALIVVPTAERAWFLHSPRNQRRSFVIAAGDADGAISEDPDALRFGCMQVLRPE